MLNLRMAVFGLVASGLLVFGQLQAQAAYNPFHEVEEWDSLPGGEAFGPLTGGFPDPDGQHMWLLGRCGLNNCADSDRDPILKFDLEGNLVDSFGAGLFAFTHGFFLDHEASADHRDIIGNARYQSKVVGDIECSDLGFLAQAIE